MGVLRVAAFELCCAILYVFANGLRLSQSHICYSDDADDDDARYFSA